ncbi:MAG: replication protein [Elusimicrobiota bacterium]
MFDIKNNFEGFISPRYTQVPDEVFDILLAHISGAELKALMYVVRRTFGFKKDSDNISFNQMMHGVIKRDGTILDYGTGLSKPTLIKALNGLVEKNILITIKQKSEDKGNLPTNYRLNLRNSTPGKEILQGGYQNFTKPPGKEIKPTIINSDLNKKEYNNNINDVAILLLRKGIKKEKAEDIALKYDEKRIKEKMNFLDFQLDNKTEINNPAGYLIRAIEEDYPVPENILKKQIKKGRFLEMRNQVINKLKSGESISIEEYIYLPSDITSKLISLYCHGRPDEYVLREEETID